MAEPLISVVTVSLNQLKFLPYCVESVAAQSDVCFEHIVVDPGSTDGSREYLIENRSLFSHSVFEPDDGPADGLNRGFAKASGSIYYFLNADDILFPGALARAARLLGSHPTREVLLGDGYRVDAEGIRNRYLCSTYMSARTFARGVGTMVQQGFFIRSEAFRRAGGFNPQNGTCWDAELLLRATSQGSRVLRDRHPYGGFRIYDDSISGSGRLYSRYLSDRRRLRQEYSSQQWPVFSTGVDASLDCLCRAKTVIRRARVAMNVRLVSKDAVTASSKAEHAGR